MNARSRGAAPAPDTDALAPWRAFIESMLHAVWLIDATTLRVVAAKTLPEPSIERHIGSLDYT